MLNTFDTDSESIRKFWNTRYREEGFIWGRGPSPCVEATLPFFEARSARRLLDLGCGYGRDVIYLGRLGLGGVLTRWNARLRQASPDEFVPLFDDLDSLVTSQTKRPTNGRARGGHR